MNFTVLGGDERSVHVVTRLLRDGHEVRTYQMERAQSVQGTACPTAEAALSGAGCVVLPVPLSTMPGMLNAPYGSHEMPLAELWPMIPAGVPVFSGAVKPGERAQAEEHGVVLTDLLTMEELAVKNAALTAEGALSVLIQETDHCLMGESILIIGAGRIGKLLGLRLRALGAKVTVSARKDSDLAWCRALCLGVADTREMELILPRFSCVVNTVPSPVLSGDRLERLPQGTIILELASKPGGVDLAAAEKCGVRVVNAGGLPGKTAPKSAAEAIVDTIYHNI